MNEAAVPKARTLPVNRLTLQFLAPEREQAYRDAQFIRSRTVFRAAIAFSIVLHTMFLYLDHLVLGQAAPLMWKLRLGILIPASAIVLLLSLHPGFQRIEQPAIALAVVTNAVIMAIGGTLFGVGSIAYFASGTVMVLIFGFVLLGLRFAWSAPAMILSVAMHVLVVMNQSLPVDLEVIAIEILILSVASLTVGAYRMELLSRTEYHATQQLLAQERREREWLGLMAGFVRHELKNAIAGIGSSLQLVASTGLDRKGDEYVSRASQSLQFMRRFLEQVGTATNLETALRQQESALLLFSELVSGCVEDARQRAPERILRDTVAGNVEVRGNADSLVQMIDKLLNNAIEHAGAGSEIVVQLTAGSGYASLEVTDIGDELPADIERLFRPFVTTKTGSPEGNLGLGLYVARTIAAFHGGSLTARPLTDAVGARFTVTLPLAQENLQAATQR